jgi:hypothetical protein
LIRIDQPTLRSTGSEFRNGQPLRHDGRGCEGDGSNQSTSGLGKLHTIEKEVQSGAAGILVHAVLADAETLQIELLVKPQINGTLPQDAIAPRRSRRLTLLSIFHIR